MTTTIHRDRSIVNVPDGSQIIFTKINLSQRSQYEPQISCESRTNGKLMDKVDFTSTGTFLLRIIIHHSDGSVHGCDAFVTTEEKIDCLVAFLLQCALKDSNCDYVMSNSCTQLSLNFRKNGMGQCYYIFQRLI